MLKAVTDDSTLVYAWEANREIQYHCPECRERVVLKKGVVRSAHFAHMVSSECPYSDHESWQHMQMKEHLIKMLVKKFSAKQVDSEISIVEGRRADIVLKNSEIPLVIECQYSPISIAELRQRTLDYLRAGCLILWVFHISRVKRDSFYERVGAVRIPEEIRYLDSKEQPLYFMDDDGRVRICELKHKYAKGSWTQPTETMCFCNFTKVRMWEFVAGFKV